MDFQNGQGIRSLGNIVSKQDIANFEKFQKDLQNGISYHKAFNNNLANSHSYIQQQASSLRELITQRNLLNRQLRTGKITQEEYNTAITANKAKMQALTTQTQSLTLSQKAATVASKGLSIAMNLLGNIAITAIIIGISKIVKGFIDLVNHVEITKKKVEDLKSTFQSALDEANSNAKRVEELADRYDELSDGVNNLGENVSLTNEEYEEYNTLVNEIADMFPTLVQGYTDEGNAILNLKGNVEALRDAYKEAQQEAYNLLIANGQDSDGNDIIKQWNNLYDTGFWASIFDFGMADVDKSISVTDAIEQLKAIQNMTAERYREIERIAGSGTAEEIATLSDIEQDIAYGSYLNKALGLTWDISDEDFAEAKRQAKILVQTYNAEIESALSDVKTLANAYLMTNEDYAKLDESSKNAASVIVNSFNADIASGFKDKTDVGKYVAEIVKAFDNQDVKNAANNLFNLDTSTMSVKDARAEINKYIDIIAKEIGEDSENLKIRLGFEDIDDTLNRAKNKFMGRLTPNDSYTAQINSFLESLSPKDLEAALNIPDLFADGLDGATAKIEAWNADPNNKITPDVDTKSLEDLQEAYDEFSKSASNFTKNQKSITSAFEEQEKYGQLSASTIQELTEAGYAQALVVDSETGAVTLNKQAYEQLNREKKRAIILEGEQQKSELATKLQEEKKAIEELGKEYAYANEERKKAILLEMEEHGASYNDIQARITSINKFLASLDAPTFGDGKDETPAEIQNFLDDYAKYHHDINMGIKKEDEDYFNWLDKAAHDAYSKYPDYLDDLWKYEEEVYKGRKQLAEDYYNDRITDLESQIEIATKYSTDKDGNPLDTQEKFDYIRSTYQEILSEIDRRRNEIIQAGLEGNGDILKELEQQYEKYVKEMADIFKDEVESEIDYIQDLQDTVEQVYDDKIDKIEAEKKAMEDRYDAEIDKIDSVIDSLEKENDQKQLALDIAKAEKELAEAQRKRNVGVLQANGTISYQADPEAITEAQNNLNELYLKRTTEALKQQKELLQKNKEIESDNYDAKINNLNADKDKWKDFYDDLVDTLNEYLNPKQKESNSNVWNTVAGEDGAVKVGKVEMSTDQIDARIGSEDIAKSLIEKLIKASNDEVKAKELVKNLDLNNAYNTLMGNSLRPVGLSELQKAGMFNNVSTQNYVNNNGQTVNLSIGDITITNPVGNSKNLAEELMKKLPNAMLQQIYKVR